MVKEYIDREAALRAILGQPPDAHYPGWYADSIKEIPAADVTPVVHGVWEYYTHTMMACSICKRHVPRHKSKYCPHCGAKMDGGNE